MFYETNELKDKEIFLKLNRTSNEKPEKGYLPAYYFDICLAGGVKVGDCDLRIGHNEKTYIGGNIGYNVDEEYRGNRYAAKACRLLFDLAKKHSLKYLIITCDTDNISSNRTCEILGGEFLEIADVPETNEMYDDGIRRVNIYKFDL